MVRVMDDNGRSRMHPDYLNLSMENYFVKEMGTFKDVTEHLNRTKSLANNNSHDDHGDL